MIMPTFVTLIRQQWLMGRRYFRRGGWASVSVVGAFIVLAAAIMVLAWYGFGRFFSYALATEQEEGLVAIQFALEAGAAVIFMLGTVSFIIAGISTLFRDRAAGLLLALPLRPIPLFFSRFLPVVFAASWPLALIGLPAIVALGQALYSPPSYYLVAAAVCVGFVAAMSALGGLIVFATAPLARRVGTGISAFVLAVAVVAAGYAAGRQLFSRALIEAVSSGTLDPTTGLSFEVARLFTYVPSHPFSQAVLIAGRGFGGFGQELMLFVSAGVAIIAAHLLLSALAARWYLPLCQDYQQGRVAAASRAATVVRAPFPRFMKIKYGYFFEKDLLLLLRNPAELSRAGFLLLLLGFIIAAVVGLSRMELFERTDLRLFAIMYAFIATAYLAFTFGMRFAFPSLSLEGKSAWVLWSSPVHLHEYFTWKFFFWSALMIVLSEAAMTAVTVLLGLPLPLGQFLALAVFCAAVTLTAITLGQGAIWPNFRDHDPDSLSTSPAGLMTTAIGLVYIAVISRYVYVFASGFYFDERIDLLAVFGLLTVSVGLVGLYWYLAPRAMEKLEI